MTAFEAVCWDIGGVVLDVGSVRRAHRAFVAWVVDAYDVDRAVDDALDAWRTAVGDHFRERDGTEFRSAHRAYARGVDAVVGGTVDWEAAFRDAFVAHIRPNPGAVETLSALAATDRHVGVVSDVDTVEGHRILETLGVEGAFDAVTTSESVGRTKPDPAMFEAALDAAGVPAERALMVGDRYDHDVVGASNAGMATALYGAGDGGPAVDYRLDSLGEVLDVVGASDARG